MAFRFSLAAVLRLREIHEQREERKLSQILAQVAQTRAAIASADTRITEATAAREADLLQSMSAAELHVAYGLAAMLKELRECSQEQLIGLNELRAKQIRIYQGAHQDRELLSTMRQKLRASFLAELGRQEQKGLDDLYLARLRHK